MPIYSNALAQRPANMLAYQDTLSATPRNEYLGALADLIAQSYAPERTQQMQGTARFLSLPAISQTLDRLSYGEPLTTGAGGLGGTTRVRPEALEAAMAVAPAAKPVTMASLQAAREARRAALGIGMAGERYAEKVVPEILNRGGLPAQMLQDLAQGTRRQVFVGEKSKTWNAANAAKAVEMEKAGAKPEEIWAATGTFRGPEGKLRQEISDVPATLLNNQKNFEGKLHETLDHPELFNSYPGLQYYHTDITSEIALPEHLKKTLIGRGSGSFTEKSFPYNEPKITAQAYSPEDKTTLLHEIQHAVQAKEGFARGGNINQFTDYTGALERARLNNGIDPVTGDADFVIEEQIKNFGVNPVEAYRRLAGEAEARAVEKRMNMTPQERLATFPYESYDVPVNQLIVRKPESELISKNKNMLSYRGSHTAPGPDFGAPLHDLTGGGQMYPADVYSAKAAQYYGTGYPKADREAFALAHRVRGNPNAEVTMYRAVPKDEKITAINPGDWVTLSKDYAKTHGEAVLDNNYKILSQKVKAKDLWTNADSIHEFGYQPQTQNP